MFTRALVIVGSLLLLTWLPCAAQDADGDGLTDAQEEVLGANPQAAESLQVIIEDGLESEERRKAEGYDPTKDVLTIEFCHVAEDRYLWRATFAEAPRLEDTVLHLYVDADADDDTGRKNGMVGTEYMLSVVGGGATSGYYAPEGARSGGPGVAFVTAGNSLLMSADVELGRDEKGVRYALYVLCHTATRARGERPGMSDSAGKKIIEGVPVVDREKIIRPCDYTASHNVTGTFGLDILRALLRDEDTIEVRHDQLELNGFAVDLFTSRRFPHLTMQRQRAKASASPPRPGTYYVGFMMYDDSRDERVVIRVNDELAGVAVANQNNNRTWLYYLSEPREFKAGDVVCLEAAGSSGKHGICNMLFFPKAPETRAIEYRVENTKWAPPVGTGGAVQARALQGGEGKVSLSWTTTWPSATRFEYGTTTDYGQIATEECYRLVHKVRLEGLKPDVTYHGRGVGSKPDGSAYYGPDITFTAQAPKPPETLEGAHRVTLAVRNSTQAPAAKWPVTAGVPFPEGVLGHDRNVRILRGEEEIPAQVHTTCRWPNGSVKWVLVSVIADAPADGTAEYVLEYGRDVGRAEWLMYPMARRAGDRVLVNTGALSFAVDSHGQIVDLARGDQQLLAPGAGCASTLVDSSGVTYRTALGDAEVVIEENGPVRTVIKTVGNLTDEAGKKSFRIEQRIEAYRGSPLMRVQHTFVNDVPEGFTNIESLSYQVPVVSAGRWQAALVEGEAIPLERGSVVQRFDKEFIRGDSATGGRIVGGLVGDGEGGCAVAVRDFWQNYPKGFTVTNQGVSIDLCPEFEAGLYDKFPFEKEGHQLYYYLLDGHYRFKRGMAKTHELFLCFAPPAERAGLCQLFQRPLLLTASPAWYCDSKAFYSVAPRDEKRFKAYEEAIDKNLEAYAKRREGQHDYGMMNYGDWYGERGSNWGNIEYDTQHAFFLEYIRSGNPEAFFLGESTEIHNRDIDTVQWSPNPSEVGAVYIHQMCHVGGYYTKSVPGTLGFPRAGYTVSHAWTEGHFGHYFLTGDRRSLETGIAVADFFINKQLGRPYDWSTCRTPGWHLILNAAALAATNDPYYLNASRIIVDRVLETQDKEPRELPEYQKEPGRTHQVGGWSRMMVPGHCLCEPRHRGNAGFMVAVLLSGLKYYWDVTEEPAVKECIIRGAHYLLDETYSEETHGFRYTSCPNGRYGTGVTPLMAEGIARAYLWTKDERFRDPLTEGMAGAAGGSSYGKGFSMYYRCAPRVLADLAACGLSLEERRARKLVPFKAPEWLTKLSEKDRIVIQAEDFSAQGGGEVQIKDDRHATWGKMITYWHQDVGHWLEWKFTVAENARYQVLFRYASSSEKPMRKFELDGKLPHPAAAAIEFKPTGGFGNNPLDWQFRTLTDQEGNDIVVSLDAGEHTIRMTNLGDGLGMDFIVLVRMK